MTGTIGMGMAIKNIDTQNPDSLKTQALDHLGLVAAVTRDARNCR